LAECRGVGSRRTQAAKISSTTEVGIGAEETKALLGAIPYELADPIDASEVLDGIAGA